MEPIYITVYAYKNSQSKARVTLGNPRKPGAKLIDDATARNTAHAAEQAGVKLALEWVKRCIELGKQCVAGDSGGEPGVYARSYILDRGPSLYGTLLPPWTGEHAP